MGRIRVTVVALLTAGFVVSGCGGTSSKPLTNSELIAKADPICKRINTQIAYYSNLKPSDHQDLLNAAAVARAAPLISATERSAQISLAKLTPSTALSEDWKQFVAGVRSLSEDSQQFANDIQAKNALATDALASSVAS